MGGIVGRLFREFAITLSVAVLVSLIVSLVTTPVMCAFLLRPGSELDRKPGRLARATEHAFQAALNFYARTLALALRFSFVTALVLIATAALTIYLYIVIPKGFFPQQDTGRLIGGIQADQSISFQLMRQKLTQLIDIVRHDRAVESVAGFTGGFNTNGGFVFVSLKPLSQRADTADQVVARLRRETAVVAGARLFSKRCRISGSAAGKATRSTSTRCKATNPSTSRTGRRRFFRRCRPTPSSATSMSISRIKGWRQIW